MNNRVAHIYPKFNEVNIVNNNLSFVDKHKKAAIPTLKKEINFLIENQKKMMRGSLQNKRRALGKRILRS
jgi:hypothetical protein